MFLVRCSLVGKRTSRGESEATAHQEDVRLGSTVSGTVPRADEGDDASEGQESKPGRGTCHDIPQILTSPKTIFLQKHDLMYIDVVPSTCKAYYSFKTPPF